MFSEKKVGRIRQSQKKNLCRLGEEGFLGALLSCTLNITTAHPPRFWAEKSANPTKWSNTLKQLFECVFDHFVGLALNGLTG